MAKKKQKKEEKKPSFDHTGELTGIVLIIISILSIVPKPFGLVGEIVASFSMFLIGTGYQILLLGVFITGCYMIWKKAKPNFFSNKMIGIYCVFIGLIVLAHINYVTENSANSMVVLQETISNLMSNFNRIATGKILTLKGAGVVGALLSIGFTKAFDVVGAYIVSFVVIIIGIFLSTGFSFIDAFKNMINSIKKIDINIKPINTKNNDKEDNKTEELSKPYVIESSENLFKIYNEKIKPIEIKQTVIEEEFEIDETTQEIVVKKPAKRQYRLPSIDILKINKSVKKTDNSIIERNIINLEKVLKDFGIIGKVVNVTEGPAITQYEMEMNSGTKVSKLLSLSREISLALAKKDVRIEAPIPGKSTIGIELPNESVSPVSLREILTNVPKGKESNKLLVVLGKNIMGQSIWCEIDKTPHLLVAGSTGSGKSVCINCIIASILMRTTPDEVKLVLVDPKKVELSMYNGIPHLLMPVVTDPKKASVALQKIVNEMENRYELFSEKNVKNIASYNEWVIRENEKRSANDKIRLMNYIVVIVDELADLMLVASKEVEDSIMRITQMARASGIHLIVATQRPSTDVITGVIKANIPSRISFAVSSGIDSRTILDAIGAEKLLGKGDMLYSPTGEISPRRVQGAYVSDDELQRIVDHTVAEQKADYDEKFLNLNTADTPSMKDVINQKEEYDDPLYGEIVDFVSSTGKISASLLQRKYRLGYNRAARIVDLLEERGIIGPANGSKPREVLMQNSSYDEE